MTSNGNIMDGFSLIDDEKLKELDRRFEENAREAQKTSRKFKKPLMLSCMIPRPENPVDPKPSEYLYRLRILPPYDLDRSKRWGMQFLHLVYKLRILQKGKESRWANVVRLGKTFGKDWTSRQGAIDPVEEVLEAVQNAEVSLYEKNMMLNCIGYANAMWLDEPRPNITKDHLIEIPSSEGGNINGFKFYLFKNDEALNIINRRKEEYYCYFVDAFGHLHFIPPVRVVYVPVDSKEGSMNVGKWMLDRLNECISREDLNVFYDVEKGYNIRLTAKQNYIYHVEFDVGEGPLWKFESNGINVTDDQVKLLEKSVSQFIVGSNNQPLPEAGNVVIPSKLPKIHEDVYDCQIPNDKQLAYIVGIADEAMRRIPPFKGFSYTEAILAKAGKDKNNGKSNNDAVNAAQSAVAPQAPIDQVQQTTETQPIVNPQPQSVQNQPVNNPQPQPQPQPQQQSTTESNLPAFTPQTINPDDKKDKMF